MDLRKTVNALAPAGVHDGGRFVTFVIGELFFGVEVKTVQEVLRAQSITRVPLAPEAVRGLINLRGQIVSAVDMHRRLGLGIRAETGDASMSIIVRAGSEATSLLVDDIGDVLDIDLAALEPAPLNIHADVRKLLAGVYKEQGRLLLILDAEQAANLQHE